MTAPQDDLLFPEIHTARYGENHRRRKLFLPQYLQRNSDDQRLRNSDQHLAYEIICRWADLEATGKLHEMKETALQGEFLTEFFGAALGYTLFSDNKKQWNLEPQFSVNGGTADAAIGLFESGRKITPRALIELKGPTVNLDRDRFNGRTPVQQCWDYLNAVSQCPWGIVCNYVSFRLYHRHHTPRAYELFTLQELRKNIRIFEQFYYLFQRDGLLTSVAGQLPRAELLLRNTEERQSEVGDELYEAYHDNRLALIRHLLDKPHLKSLDSAIHIAQKLLDRIIFVAFCEDRGFLPARLLHTVYTELPPFRRVTNPRWQNFLELFRSIDEGSPQWSINRYNGNLFKEDPEVDNLQLDDSWTDFFKNIGSYDFRDEVNLEVLGHLFERSVHDIERIRTGGFFDLPVEPEERPKMVKSAERKRFGIFYTPAEFTQFIADNTVGALIEQRLDAIAQKHRLKRDEVGTAGPDPQRAALWRACLDELRQIKIVDPACGSGAFLFQAYDLLDGCYQDIIDHLVYHEGDSAEDLRNQVPDYILHDNLFGVDLSEQAVEITQLALWIRSARRGKTLADLSRNVVCGNSLVADPDVHPRALNWADTFPEIFERENLGFDCVIGNPPWERMKVQEREFFDFTRPDIAAAVNAATRRKLIARLEKDNPELFKLYVDAKKSAELTLDYVRASGRYQLTGKGDINTYAAFAELAHNIVNPHGRVGLLVPSGIATDHTTRKFFAQLVDAKSLVALYDFENRKKIFPDVDGRYKFCVLLFGGSRNRSKASDFVFFAHKMDDLKDKNRHISLSADDFKLLNPNTSTCPVFRSRRDAELTKAIYRRVPVLIDQDRKEGGNPWGIKFFTMFHQTNDAELFHTAEKLKKEKFKRSGPLWKKGKKTFLPLYEAKMVQMYDHRAAGIVIKDENWFRQGQTDAASLVSHQNPEFCVEPRWWADQSVINNTFGGNVPVSLLAFKNVTSPTNQRTMIASFIPPVGVINSAPIILFADDTSVTKQCCFLANLNAFALDYVARQKIGNVNLNFFLIEQFPMFPPDFYSDRCPWHRRETLEKWISERVLKLTCTSNDMIPLAQAAGFDPPVYKWKPDERADLMAQLDAAYFVLYGLERDDVKYILSTFTGAGKESQNLFAPSRPFDLILTHYDQMCQKSQP